MNESIRIAYEEIKRADHLIYVSLKYTRSVDVLRSVVDRLINTYDIIINAILEKAKEEGKIDNNPESPSLKCNVLSSLYPEDEELGNYIDFYRLLRRIMRSEFTGAHEFRRNVTMSVMIEDKIIEVNIDIVTEYYKKSLDFLNYTKNILEE